MSTPISVLTAQMSWATDENFTAGADPWSGTPTKVAPSTQSKAQGFTPEAPASAEQINYVLNGSCEISKYLMSLYQTLPVLNFRPAVGFALFHAAWDVVNNAWIAPGTGAHVVRKSSDGGFTWSTNETAALAGTTIGWRVAVSSVDGSVVVTTDTRAIYERSAAGTWTLRATALPFALDAGKFYEVIHNRTSGRWIAFGCDTTHNSVFAYSSDRITWTTAIYPTFGVSGNSEAALAMDQVTGTVVAANVPLPLSLGTVEVHTSSLDGTDWPSATIVITHGYTASTRMSCTWDARAGLFIIAVCSLAGGSKVYTSPDGSTWTLVCTLTTDRLLKVAVLGEIWAAIRYLGGVAFSLDRGVTWNDAGYAPETLQQLVSAQVTGGAQLLALGSANAHPGIRGGLGGTLLT